MVFKYTTSYLVMICYFNYAWLLVGVGTQHVGTQHAGTQHVGTQHAGTQHAGTQHVGTQHAGNNYHVRYIGAQHAGTQHATRRHAGAFVHSAIITPAPPTPHNTTWQIKDLKTFLHYRLTS